MKRWFQRFRMGLEDSMVMSEHLHEELQSALSDDEVERRELSKALLPHVRRFYSEYFDPQRHEPFYRPSSRV